MPARSKRNRRDAARKQRELEASQPKAAPAPKEEVKLDETKSEDAPEAKKEKKSSKKKSKKSEEESSEE